MGLMQLSLTSAAAALDPVGEILHIINRKSQKSMHDALQTPGLRNHCMTLPITQSNIINRIIWAASVVNQAQSA